MVFFHKVNLIVLETLLGLYLYTCNSNSNVKFKSYLGLLVVHYPAPQVLESASAFLPAGPEIPGDR